MYQLSPSHRARQGVLSPNESSCRSESLILIFILRYLPLKLYDVLTEGNPVGAMNVTQVKEGVRSELQTSPRTPLLSMPDVFLFATAKKTSFINLPTNEVIVKVNNLFEQDE